MAEATQNMTADEPSDAELIEGVKSCSDRALELLMRRYRQELFHFLIRFTGSRASAEDVFQETFVQVYTSANIFDTSRRFKPWLFTIAANKARDLLRKEGRRSTVALSASVGESDESPSFVDLMEADLPDPGDRIADEELSEAIQDVVKQLPDHLQEILHLAYFQRFSYNEIADVLNVPLGTVKSRLHTAVGQFARKWKLKYPEMRPPSA